MVNISRSIRVAALGTIRREMFHGREHVVVPVVALKQGVLFAANAEHPELVLSTAFQDTVAAWNGRPVMYDHPQVDGKYVSANSPAVLQRSQIGVIFATIFADDSLRMEAWLDPELIVATGSDELLSRLENAQLVDVSIGARVVSEDGKGVFEGESYDSVWTEIDPDHLAMLPPGVPGACSLEMGCGAPRVAASGKGTGMKFAEKVAAIVARLKAAAAMTEPDGALEGVSSNDLSSALWNALYGAEPAFLGIVDVYQDAKSVIYCVAPDGEECYMKRTYAVGESDAITLNDDAVEVHRVVEWEPVAPGAMDSQEVVTAAASGCGCGGKKTIAALEDKTMSKKAYVSKILARKGSPFKAEDAAVLEQFPEERLKVLAEGEEAPETPAAPPVPETPVAPPVVPPTTTEPELTEQKVLSMFPNLKRAVDAENTRVAARHTELVGKLGEQKIYSAEELKAMSVDQLEKLVALASSGKRTVVDFSAANANRSQTPSDENVVPKAPDLVATIKAARAGK